MPGFSMPRPDRAAGKALPPSDVELKLHADFSESRGYAVYRSDNDDIRLRVYRDELPGKTLREMGVFPRYITVRHTVRWSEAPRHIRNR